MFFEKSMALRKGEKKGGYGKFQVEAVIERGGWVLVGGESFLSFQSHIPRQTPDLAPRLILKIRWAQGRRTQPLPFN